MFFFQPVCRQGDLFEGLSVWDEKTPEGEYRFRELQGTFPVIFVSFASIESPTYKGMLYQISEEVSILYARNRYLLEGNVLSESERKYYDSIVPGIDGDGSGSHKNDGGLSVSLLQ